MPKYLLSRVAFVFLISLVTLSAWPMFSPRASGQEGSEGSSRTCTAPVMLCNGQMYPSCRAQCEAPLVAVCDPGSCVSYGYSPTAIAKRPFCRCESSLP
jgi:hypothetical protein